MPIYEYACGKCEHEFEVEQRITDDPVKTCPACRSRKVKRLISQTSFVLKGGGWYSDLYSSNQGAGKSDSGDGGDKDKGKGEGKGKGKGKSESKDSGGSKGESSGSGGKGGKGSSPKAAA